MPDYSSLSKTNASKKSRHSHASCYYIIVHKPTLYHAKLKIMNTKYFYCIAIYCLQFWAIYTSQNPISPDAKNSTNPIIINMYHKIEECLDNYSNYKIADCSFLLSYEKDKSEAEAIDPTVTFPNSLLSIQNASGKTILDKVHDQLKKENYTDTFIAILQGLETIGITITHHKLYDAWCNKDGTVQLNCFTMARYNRLDDDNATLFHTAAEYSHEGTIKEILHMHAQQLPNNPTKVEKSQHQKILNIRTAKEGKTALIMAIDQKRRKTNEIAQLLLTAEADCNISDNEGYFPVHHINNASPAIAAQIIQQTNNINSRTKNGSTPLLLACKSLLNKKDLEWKIQNIKMLLQKPNININQQSNHTETPAFALISACFDLTNDRKSCTQKQNHTQSYQNSLAHHNNKPITTKDANLYIFNKLLNIGIDHTATYNAEGNDSNPTIIQSLLHFITQNYCFKCTKNTMLSMIEHGADVNNQNNFGDTCLHIAIIVGRYDAALFLIKQGANLQQTNYAGKIPTDYLEKNNDRKNARKCYEWQYHQASSLSQAYDNDSDDETNLLKSSIRSLIKPTKKQQLQSLAKAAAHNAKTNKASTNSDIVHEAINPLNRFMHQTK